MRAGKLLGTIVFAALSTTLMLLACYAFGMDKGEAGLFLALILTFESFFDIWKRHFDAHR